MNIFLKKLIFNQTVLCHCTWWLKNKSYGRSLLTILQKTSKLLPDCMASYLPYYYFSKLLLRTLYIDKRFSAVTTETLHELVHTRLLLCYLRFNICLSNIIQST
jgi:hypothetical protein